MEKGEERGREDPEGNWQGVSWALFKPVCWHRQLSVNFLPNSLLAAGKESVPETQGELWGGGEGMEMSFGGDFHALQTTERH